MCRSPHFSNRVVAVQGNLAVCGYSRAFARTARASFGLSLLRIARRPQCACTRCRRSLPRPEESLWMLVAHCLTRARDSSLSVAGTAVPRMVFELSRSSIAGVCASGRAGPSGTNDARLDGRRLVAGVVDQGEGPEARADARGQTQLRRSGSRGHMGWSTHTIRPDWSFGSARTRLHPRQPS